jgi:BirA family biotin operon repressor/biotin-[acetyl-CoA-carboxylase] ligase
MAVTARSQTQKRQQKLLALLSDGKSHSGQALARRLDVSRSAVWKLVRVLQASGIAIEAEARQGYRLPQAVSLLGAKAIVAAIPEEMRSAFDRVEVLLNVDSTNRYLIENTDCRAEHARVCVAEVQTAGRGRRGRSWVAPFGSGICMSLAWQFNEAPPTFSALSLAVGVAVVKAFRRMGAADVGLKWPNDLMWQKRKLGGILIEMRGESGGPAYVVIGLGINVQMPSAVRLALAEQQAALIADVHEILRSRTPPRNAIVALLCEEIVTMLRAFAVQGFAPFVDEWRQLDVLADASVKVINGNATTLGTARGVEADGSLIVDVAGVRQRFVSGEVSLRARG